MGFVNSEMHCSGGILCPVASKGSMSTKVLSMDQERQISAPSAGSLSTGSALSELGCLRGRAPSPPPPLRAAGSFIHPLREQGNGSS